MLVRSSSRSNRSMASDEGIEPDDESWRWNELTPTPSMKKMQLNFNPEPKPEYGESIESDTIDVIRPKPRVLLEMFIESARMMVIRPKPTRTRSCPF